MKTTQVREFGKNIDEKETFFVEPKERVNEWKKRHKNCCRTKQNKVV